MSEDKDQVKVPDFKASKWISVEESLPESGKRVLCRIKPKKDGVMRYEVGRRMGNGVNTFIVGNHFEWDLGKVTHWMNIDSLMF